MSGSTLPKITLIALGGTIAMTAQPAQPAEDSEEAGDAKQARSSSGIAGKPSAPETRATPAGGTVAPGLDVHALVHAVPALRDVAELTAVQFRQLPGAHLKISDLIELAAEITARIDAGAAGVVITQGTDTIDESAFALDLLVDREAPVVVTGAMRNPTMPGADGPANLLASARVAASVEARGLGTVVVFNDEIHAARYVQKTHTTSTATFRSPTAGPLGWIIEDKVAIAMRPTARQRIIASGRATTDTGRLIDRSMPHPVALLPVSLGDDGRLLEAIERLGYEGLVVEAFGAGHVPDTWVDSLEHLARRMPVVLASRTGSGEMLRSTYGFRGSESDLLARGLISAGELSGPKARILLSLLLHITTDRAQIERHFVQSDQGRDRGAGR